MTRPVSVHAGSGQEQQSRGADTIWYLLIALAVVGLAIKLRVDSGLLAGAGKGASGGRAKAFPYRTVPALLTPAERSFYEVLIGVLDQRAAGRYILFVKVRLSDLIKVIPGTEKRGSFQNSVISKHVDFVLCARQTLAPVLPVELDDSSHNRPKRQSRDEFLNAALGAAGLPVVHIRNQHSYVARDVYEQVAAALAN